MVSTPDRPMSRDETEPEEITDPIPLTWVQRWFFSRVDGAAASHFNLSLLLETPPLDPAPLAAALAFLPRHHETLRLRFRRRPEGWEQGLEAPDAAPPGLLALDLSTLPEERMSGAVTAVAREVQASLDLTRGPVQRIVSFDLGARRSRRLLWVMHHLVLDAISWRVLLQDLAVAYGCLARGLPVQLPPKTTSFERWVELLREHAASPELAAELPFWRDLPWGAVTPLPQDIPSGADLQVSERSVTLELDREETRALLSEIPQAHQTTIKEVLLTAVARAFAAWTAAPVLLVHVEGHGRVGIFPGSTSRVPSAGSPLSLRSCSTSAPSPIQAARSSRSRSSCGGCRPAAWVSACSRIASPRSPPPRSASTMSASWTRRRRIRGVSAWLPRGAGRSGHRTCGGSTGSSSNAPSRTAA
jgi:hypothetical protein